MIDPLGGIPEQVEPEPEPQRMPRPARPTTWALLGVLAVAFVAQGVVGKDPSVEDVVALFRLGALYPAAVRDGDFWRVGSYALLHIGWLHLLFNAYALWILAPQLELTYGSNLTLGFFCATALAGGVASTAWSFSLGADRFAAGASGGIFGLFGATVALYLRLRKALPEPVRRGVMRAIGINLLINLVIAFTAPVDNAAHLGGFLAGVVFGLLAPLARGERRPWHGIARAVLVLAALAFASLEGAAVARAVKPRARTLRGPGVEAQVPWLLVPQRPGVAAFPDVAEVRLTRQDKPLRISPGEDAVRIGERTWLRRRWSEDGTERATYEAADGNGTLVIEFDCQDRVCRGAAGESMVASIARTARSLP